MKHGYGITKKAGGKSARSMHKAKGTGSSPTLTSTPRRKTPRGGFKQLKRS